MDPVSEDNTILNPLPPQVSYPHRAGDMKTHLDRPLVVNPQDNRNNNTNKTRPGEPPLDPQDTLGHQRAEEYIRRQACYHQRNRGGEPRGVSGPEREARQGHGGSRLSLQTLEGIEERREHGRRCRHKEGKEGRSVSPHYSEGGVGDEKRRHRRVRREGEEGGRRHKGKGTEGVVVGEGGEVEGEGRRPRRHRHGERSRQHRVRK